MSHRDILLSSIAWHGATVLHWKFVRPYFSSVHNAHTPPQCDGVNQQYKNQGILPCSAVGVRPPKAAPSVSVPLIQQDLVQGFVEHH